VLAEALRAHEPWLEWAGKREAGGFEVDPVALNIHERVSAQAIIKAAARQDVTRDLFADLRIPRQGGHRFHGKLDSDSTASWTPIPGQAGHLK
jgi:adenine-specific DNA-methyltransferase